MAKAEYAQRAPVKDRFMAAVVDNIRNRGIVYKDPAGSIRVITHNRRLKKIVCLYNHDENNNRQLESRTVTHLPRKFSLADSDYLRD